MRVQATGRAHTWTSIEGHACGGYKEEAESKASQAQRCVHWGWGGWEAVAQQLWAGGSRKVFFFFAPAPN